MCACSEEERLRIEAKNPNPKMPLVRYVGGTWRVGGILALSRAFGDAYMKSSLQFEGLRASSDGYSSGFGVIAEPDTSLIELTGVAPGPLVRQYYSHYLRVLKSCCLHNACLSVYSMVMLQSLYDSITFRASADGTFAISCIMSNLLTLIGCLHNESMFW